MMVGARAEALIGAFGELVGLADLSLDSTGTCEFDVNEGDVGLQIQYDRARGRFALRARRRLDDPPTAGAMTALLEHNASSTRLKGDVMALDTDGTALILVRGLDEVPDAQSLAVSVEAAIADLLEWRSTEAAVDGLSQATEPGPGMRV